MTDARQRLTAPKLEEQLDKLYAMFGGADAFAREIKYLYDTAPMGSALRFRIIDMMMTLMKARYAAGLERDELDDCNEDQLMAIIRHEVNRDDSSNGDGTSNKNNESKQELVIPPVAAETLVDLTQDFDL